MRILVANLGSTSFKFKVLDMSQGGAVIQRGSHERIGQAGAPYATHGQVIEAILPELAGKVDAIGFKAVHGGPISGAVRVTDEVIATMEQFADVAPAHNPPYIAAMRAFAQVMPNMPQVAAFETAFHQTIPASRQVYGIPHQWTEDLGIRRYGFHGASHRFIAQRSAELLGKKASRVISCHLGGSSSICAIHDGKSVASSFGMTAQSGLPQNNRVGDFDVFALQKLLKRGLSMDEIFRTLGKEGGLLGISGVSNDMRDIEAAAASGNARAQLALDVFVESVRHYIGAFAMALGGLDVLVFTGGIGENGVNVRQAICMNMDFLGLKLDGQRNGPPAAGQSHERCISTDDSTAAAWIIPTNEELIVARLTEQVLQ